MNKLDESLYSRQIAVYGKTAMHSLTNSKVQIIGFDGSSLELCKNLILAGVSQIKLHTDHKIKMDDLSTNYYAKPENIGSEVLSVIKDKLSELNPYVKIEIDNEFDFTFDVTVLINSDFKSACFINSLCRENKKSFIWINTYGLMGNVFCDFGDEFIVNDINGEQESTSILQFISNDGIFTCIDTEPHDLCAGDKFKLSSGNKVEYFIVDKIINRFSFKVKETNDWANYNDNYIITQVKQPVTLKFRCLEKSISKSNYS